MAQLVDGSKTRRQKNNVLKGVAKAWREQKRREAEERQVVAQKRSPREQLARLDAKFGLGKGARKERNKLESLITK